MDSSQILFDLASSLTCGLITDVQSLFVGGLVLLFILIGLDYLKDGFDSMMSNRDHDRYMDTARNFRMERDKHLRGTAEWDEVNLLYRHYIGRAAKSRM